jgi:lipopolysaccharide export system permease protein
MIRILDRLVAGSFLKVFLTFIVGAPILFILGDLTDNLKRFLDRGLSVPEVLHAYFFMIPQYFQWSFPVAAMVATVFTVLTMTQHREIVAAKAGGISFHRLVLPLFLMGALLAGVALGLEGVVPRSYRRASEILEQVNPLRENRSFFVFQGEGGRNFSIRNLTVSSGTITGVSMERIEPGSNRAADHLIAEVARYEPEIGWTFEMGFYRLFPEGGKELAFQFGSLRTRGFTERPPDLLDDPRKPEEMTYIEMGRLADIQLRSGGRPTKLLTDREEKLAVPLLTFVIVLFGAPLATSTKRGGTAYGIGMALLSTILYLLLFRLSTGLGETGAMEPFTAAWLPNFCFLVVGLFLLVRVRT